jgi:hypothetical protein
VSQCASQGFHTPLVTPEMAAAFLIGCGRFTNWWIRLSRTDRMTPEGTIVALWISWLASWGIAAFWSNRTEKKGGIAAYVGSRILFYVSATLLLAPLSDRHYYAQMQFWHPNATERWILVALTAAGFLFVWWASHSLGAPLVGPADEKGWSSCRRYRSLSHRAASDLFGPHIRRVRNRRRERNFLRVVWSCNSNHRLLHKSASRGTIPAGRNRRRGL